ncbi:TPA: hypothetical protein ACY369_002123 [Pasteurella multocida]
MKNCVVKVKKVDLDKLCQAFSQFSLRKYFNEQYQKFIVSIELYDRGPRSYSWICQGFEESDMVLFTYSGDEQFTNFFIQHRIPFYFLETDEISLNNGWLIPVGY